MILGIDPKVDYAFKQLFGRDRDVNHRLLISLLHAVLRLPPDGQIISVQLLNPFHEREALDDRLAVVDVKVRDQQGRQYTIEMQMLVHPFLPERLLYYWAKLYPQPLSSGQDYAVLRPTVVICFLDDVLFPTAIDQHHWRFQLRDHNRSDILLTAQLEIHVLELPKFRVQVEELHEPLEKWLYFLRHAAKLDLRQLPAQLQANEIQQALEELRMLSQDQLERERYEARLRVQMDESIRKKAATIWAEEALKKGIDEGLAKGLAAGRAQGRAETQLEYLVSSIQLFQRGLKRTETARDTLLAMPLEELQRLLNQLQQDTFGPPAS